MSLEKKSMKEIFTTALFVLILLNFASAQKRATFMGDAWTGEVVSTDDATRQITIKYEDKGKTEIFVGVIAEGYKVKMKDGSSHELKVSEIPSGTRIRVFSKTKKQVVGGREAKVNLIFRIVFLGKDEFVTLREHLNLAPSTSVTPAESTDLPAGNRLKLYLAIEDANMRNSFVAWLTEWNKERAQRYGSLELVPDVLQSDIGLVVYLGSEKVTVPLQIEMHDEDGNVHKLAHATAYLVTRTEEGLKILWSQGLILTERSERATRLIEKEIEKRMKARSQATKK